MNDDKPFACSVSDCGMKFINEDHLVVHRKKHELSLSLTPSLLKSSFFDQTPTPTKFLNAFDSELFQDLQSDNPFEATFRKANSIGENTSVSIPESSSLISDSEPLNTPSITLTNETDIQTFTSHRHSLSLKTPPSKRRDLDNVAVISPETLPFIPSDKLPLDTKAIENTKATSISNSYDTKLVVDETSNLDDQEFSDALSVDQGLVVQTPVITSVGNLTKSCSTGVPTAVVVTHTSTSEVPNSSSSVSQMSGSTKSVSESTFTEVQPVVQSVAAPVVQLIIRFPDGQSIPVEFPVTATLSEAPPNAPIKNSAGISARTTASSIAKMKLKQALASSQKKTIVHGVSSNLNNRLNRSYTSPPSENCSLVPGSTLNSFHRAGSTGRRRRDIEDNPDEKRRKSLERNRAAATRCRQKRKKWVQTLGSKADELAATNTHLQHEVTMLRNEVAHLKTMLLAHKNCPVTQQQKASGYGQMLFNENTSVITYPVQGDSIMPVTQSMDTETSSSQSDSVSDTSETSMKDR